MRAVVALLLIALAAACGGDSALEPVTDDELAALRQLGHGPLYWAGREVGGLPLTHAESQQPGNALFVYGDCDPGGGLFSEGGCAPPIQVQQFPFRPAQWRRAYECHRLPALRNVPTARHDGLVVFTGTSVVKVYARDPGEDRAVVLVLRTLDGGRELPPPPPRIAAMIDRACGTT